MKHNPIWKKVNAWENTNLYQVSISTFSANVEVETIKDRTGGYKRVTSSFGDFEVKNMAEVRLTINKQFELL